MCKSIIMACLLALGLLSCNSSNKGDESEKEYSEARTRMEKDARNRLAQARRQLASGQPRQARETIKNMRKQCYLAIDARNQGIVLMDSVDLYLAKQELARVDSLMRMGKAVPDSLRPGKDAFEDACRKVQFYERKIQFDKQPKADAKANNKH